KQRDIIDVLPNARRHSRLGDDSPVHRRFRAELLGIGEQVHRHLSAAIVEMPRHHEAVAAVVALAAADGDRTVDTERPQEFGRPPTGVSHEHERRHAILVDGAAIEITDLCATEMHGTRPSPADTQAAALEERLDFAARNPVEVAWDRMLDGAGGDAVVEA